VPVLFNFSRRVKMDEALSCCLLPEERCQRASTLVSMRLTFPLTFSRMVIQYILTYMFLFFTVDHHLGRAVIMFGIPYVYTQSRVLKVCSHLLLYLLLSVGPSVCGPSVCPSVCLSD
jgi:hypothetical protein